MPTQPSVVKGWKVGDPVNNLTKKGGIPKWDTIRQRYWKNEAHFHPEKYIPENLARMKKGGAEQRARRGISESRELHHEPPQRSGGLFDVQRVWPEEHSAIDRFRRFGD